MKKSFYLEKLNLIYFKVHIPYHVSNSEECPVFSVKYQLRLSHIEANERKGTFIDHYVMR